MPQDLCELRDRADGIPVDSELRVSYCEPFAAPTRSNVFDDDHLDAAKLRRGKSCGSSSQIRASQLDHELIIIPCHHRLATADLLLADRSFLTDELKAAIIERAERESSDEEDDERDGGFLSDGGEDKGFKVRDGEDGEDEAVVDTPPTHDALANPITPAVAKALELAFIADPTVFDRTNVVKRSKQRANLRDKTGLADEQLEGWRTMLERNVRPILPLNLDSQRKSLTSCLRNSPKRTRSSHGTSLPGTTVQLPGTKTSLKRVKTVEMVRTRVDVEVEVEPDEVVEGEMAAEGEAGARVTEGGWLTIEGREGMTARPRPEVAVWVKRWLLLRVPLRTQRRDFPESQM